jgi:hypothetical protein
MRAWSGGAATAAAGTDTCAQVQALEAVVASVSTRIGAAPCAASGPTGAAFNTQLDAAKAQLGTILAAGSPALTAAVASMEAERAKGNAEFDAALPHC